MFAKVFGQIFDSSIAEDYNCRRMFMDMLVLADPTGAVDMTFEAISRRTNVPIEEVRKYIHELSQPDGVSRSTLEDGKRLVPLDSHRDWGWQVVNYQHYRDLKDQETLRKYFRDKQRSRRKSLKQKKKEMSKTAFDKEGQTLTPSSSSKSTSSVLKEEVRGRFEEWKKFRKTLKRVSDWDTMFAKQAKWLQQFSEAQQLEILDQSIRNGWQGLFEPSQKISRNTTPVRPLDARELRLEREYRESQERLRQQ